MSFREGLLNQWIAAEKDFAANRYDGQARPAVEVIHGSSRPWLILTAPHAVNHWREGNLKLADRGTGGLVRVLSRILGCQGLITAKQIHLDASYDEEHELKDRLEEVASRNCVLIDFHGMTDQRDIDVEVGLGLSPSDASEKLALRVELELSRASLRVAHHEVYVSPHPHSITNWGLSHGLPAIQVELAARVRPPLGSHSACETLISALQDCLSVNPIETF